MHTVTPVAYRKTSDAKEARRLSAAFGLPRIATPLAPQQVSDLLANREPVRSAVPMRLIKQIEPHSNIADLAQHLKTDPKKTGLLYVDGNTLTLFCHSPISKHPLSLCLDFTTPKMRSMATQQNKKSLLAKAMGNKIIKKESWIVDATAGLGQDAFLMAFMGYQVTLLERSPVVAALLGHAIGRVKPDSWAFGAACRMTLQYTDAGQWLVAHSQSVTAKKPSVIYLDPMFPHPDKKALSQKSMQMLQQLVGPDQDADTLLPLAQAVATERVIVKRHRASPYLNAQSPHICFEGKSHRFDIYLSLGYTNC